MPVAIFAFVELIDYEGCCQGTGASTMTAVPRRNLLSINCDE